jgi:soluble lytic murein transglycosylase
MQMAEKERNPKRQRPASSTSSQFGFRSSAVFRPSDLGLRPCHLPILPRLDVVSGVGYKCSVKWRRLLLPLVLIFAAGGLVVYWWWQDRLERSQDGPIRAAARRYGVEPALVKAIVWRESRFHPQAQGRAEEIGLMQLREEAAREWASAEQLSAFEHAHCFDPGTNTLAGTWYLRKLWRRYAQTDNPLPYALADYNAGRGNVLKWIQGAAATNSVAFIDQIGFPGTREYVRSVIRRYEHYQPLFRPDTPSPQTREGERPREP